MHFEQISPTLQYRSIFPTYQTRLWNCNYCIENWCLRRRSSSSNKKILITSPTFRLFATDFAPEWKLIIASVQMIVRAIVSEWVSLLYSHPHTVNGTKKVRLENETMSSRNNNNFVCGNVFRFAPHNSRRPSNFVRAKKAREPWLIIMLHVATRILKIKKIL